MIGKMRNRERLDPPQQPHPIKFLAGWNFYWPKIRSQLTTAVVCLFVGGFLTAFAYEHFIIRNKEATIETLKQQLVGAANQNKSQEFSEENYIHESGILNVGESFIDPLTKASVGIDNVAWDLGTGGVTISLPGESTKSRQPARIGSQWNYTYKEKHYILQVSMMSTNQTYSITVFSK